MARRYGQQSTETPLQANRYFDVTDAVFLKKPDESPLTALMVGLQKTKSGDPEFKWFNKDIRAQATTASAQSLAGATLTVADASLFVPGDVIRVIDQTLKTYLAIHRVTAVNTSTNVLTLVRGLSGTTDATIASGDTILRIGNAQQEYSAIPTPVGQDLIPFSNYTQIFRHSSSYSRTFWESTKFFADMREKELQTNRNEKRKEHTREIESALWWGAKGIESSGSSNVRRMTGGIDYWLAQSATAGVENRVDIAGAGASTLAGFQAFLAGYGFAYGGQEKWGFASAEVLAILGNLVINTVRTENHLTKIGMNVTTFEFSSGTLHLVRHDLFRYGLYRNALVVIDPAHIDLRYVGDAMTRFKTDVGLPSDDGYQDSWLSEVGMEVAIPETMARWGNIVS
jgi:hypothetical protein